MHPVRDPEFWRKRAAQTRAKMGSRYDRDSRVDLLRIAEEYDRIAENAERWQKTEDEGREALLPHGHDHKST
ncbi:hypothetical protein [Bradyrhizobium sp. LMTR 3]|uniref:hypothetical protein n=1 Tax=Bradyrhizobium sp. LMTR 3 TaxID=189873 RepID=UPI0011472DC8|nr:hypothetical protein [Bradyrhizobium sp. LMTR 3]